MKKKLHLKQSARNMLDYLLILTIFIAGISISIQSVKMSSNQTKMTESVAMNQSKN